MRYVDVLNQQADADEGIAYPVDTSALSEASVAMVVP